MTALVLAQTFERSFHGVTTLHPLGLATVVVLSLVMIAVQRQWAIVPVLVMACFVSQAQRIVVGGLDLNMIRLMVLAGMVRVVMRQEYRGFTWMGLDTAIIVWSAAKTVVYTLQQGDTGLIFMLGQSYDSIGLYFLFRCLINDLNDIDRLAFATSLLLVPMLLAFMLEKSTGRNIFSVFGGVPARTIVRFGRLRCQGAFPHAILAGCFSAVLLPIVAARVFRPELTARLLAIWGVVAILGIVVLSSSSTPLMSVVAAAIATPFILVRQRLRWVRLGAVVTLVGLHFAMNNPVWHLVARMDVVGGSTGYHRYRLIDQAIKHFDEWFLIGTPSTAHWGHVLYDVTNQYILEGVRGGLIGMVLFIWLLVLAFKYVGQIRRHVEGDRAKLAMTWAIGVSLFVHSVTFIGVSYFGQMVMLWYLSLAMAASIAAHYKPATSTQSAHLPVSPRSGGQALCSAT